MVVCVKMISRLKIDKAPEKSGAQTVKKLKVINFGGKRSLEKNRQGFSPN